MKRLITTVLAGVLGAVMAVPAFANESPVITTPMEPFSEADISLIFEADAEPMQLATLSPQEMKETEGAVIWNGIIGGGAGLGTYLYNTPRDQWSLGGAAWNTAVGVASGYGVGSLVKVIGPYSSGGWGVAVNKGFSNPFTLQSNAQQAARFNFNGFTPTTVHHRLNGTGFNQHSTYGNFFGNLFR